MTDPTDPKHVFFAQEQILVLDDQVTRLTQVRDDLAARVDLEVTEVNILRREVKQAEADLLVCQQENKAEPPCGMCGTRESPDGDWYRVCGPCWVQDDAASVVSLDQVSAIYQQVHALQQGIAQVLEAMRAYAVAWRSLEGECETATTVTAWVETLSRLIAQKDEKREEKNV